MIALLPAIAFSAGPDDVTGWGGIRWGQAVGKPGMSMPGYPASGMTSWTGAAGDGVMPGTTCKVRANFGTLVDTRLVSVTFAAWDPTTICRCLEEAWGPAIRSDYSAYIGWNGASVSVVCAPGTGGVFATSLVEEKRCKDSYPSELCINSFLQTAERTIPPPPEPTPSPAPPSPEQQAMISAAEARNAAVIDAAATREPKLMVLPLSIPPWWPETTWPHGPEQWQMYLHLWDAWTGLKGPGSLTAEERAMFDRARAAGGR